MSVIHVLVDGKPLCGVKGNAAGVLPHKAKYVTCKRCIASMRTLTG